jgi:hypothetical protein
MHELNLLSLHLVVHVLTVCERKDPFIMLPEESHEKEKTLVHNSDARRISSACGVLVNFIKLLHFENLERFTIVRPYDFVQTFTNL